ncbi:hypothetical protein L228DRAFT_139800 [Xylona heveae TC161]|uniref:Uncharacterized protein n=1 Tax=Xylona heveae (strain CBS 132557 / TC161) TaxID=1328760 RepID=A0A165H3G2_XYLHT|nr:hypothetical protein L228DRAFT_139800 [Xylona heveae TC161]KZF22931.1 hypothetical protein L228DRAFT_139800 [Xylona heveae TC161]
MSSYRQRNTAAALTTLAIIYNAVSAYLLYQLPDDPYHLASNFSLYASFAGLLSILGLVGVVKENATLVGIFANYHLIDTILCSIPRFLVLTLFSGFRDSFCVPDSSFAFQKGSSSGPSRNLLEQFDHGERRSSSAAVAVALTDSELSLEHCLRVVWVVQIIAFVGIVGTTLVQFYLGLQVRDYANRLFMREQARDEERVRAIEQSGVAYEDDNERPRVGALWEKVEIGSDDLDNDPVPPYEERAAFTGKL